MKKSLLRFVIALFLFLGVGQLLTAQITAKFQSPVEWSEVYCYVWGPNDYLGVWPGTLMTEQADGWYSISDDTLSAGNFIFNNGTGDGAVQTVNQFLSTGVYCFITTGALVGTEVEIQEIACETAIKQFSDEQKGMKMDIYPNPADDILQIRAAGKIDNVFIYSITGAQVMNISQMSESGMIHIGDIEPGMFFISVTFNDGRKVTQKLIRQ